MKLEFAAVKMLLANVNARSEVHGEDREPAGDIKLECDRPNDILANFHPALKSLLFYYEDGRQRDLVDDAKKAEPGFAPDLRMPNLEYPVKWGEEMAGAHCELAIPGTKSVIILDPVKVNNFSIEPREGGTVSLSFRVQAHPDEKAFGKLCSLIQTEVEVTLTAAEEVKGN